MNKIILALFVLTGLAAGQFIYQALLASSPNYTLAAERSFFQAMALIAYLIADARQ